MFHYTESGLCNVWLSNGYIERDGPYGKTVSIADVDGLHRAIGRSLVDKPHLTGPEFRFLRKELALSQRALAGLLGVTEQSLSLWERRGRVPRAPVTLVRMLYLETVLQENVRVQELLQRLSDLDAKQHQERLQFRKHGSWRIAA